MLRFSPNVECSDTGNSIDASITALNAGLGIGEHASLCTNPITHHLSSLLSFIILKYFHPGNCRWPRWIGEVHMLLVFMDLLVVTYEIRSVIEVAKDNLRKRRCTK